MALSRKVAPKKRMKNSAIAISRPQPALRPYGPKKIVEGWESDELVASSCESVKRGLDESVFSCCEDIREASTRSVWRRSGVQIC